MIREIGMKHPEFQIVIGSTAIATPSKISKEIFHSIAMKIEKLLFDNPTPKKSEIPKIEMKCFDKTPPTKKKTERKTKGIDQTKKEIL